MRQTKLLFQITHVTFPTIFAVSRCRFLDWKQICLQRCVKAKAQANSSLPRWKLQLDLRARVSPFENPFFFAQSGRDVYMHACLSRGLGPVARPVRVCKLFCAAHNELHFSQPAKHRLSYFLLSNGKKKKKKSEAPLATHAFPRAEKRVRI